MSNDSTPLWNLFNEVSLGQGQKLAIIQSATGESLSYAALRSKAMEFSEALSVLPYKAVAIVGEPDLNLLPIFLSAAQLGVACVPLSDSGPNEVLADVLSALPVDCLVLSTRKVPGLKEEQQFVRKGLDLFAYVSYGNNSGTPMAIPYLVTHSSGSTGRPKPIAIRQETKIKRTQQSIRLFGVNSSDVILSVSPLHHSLGQRHLFLALLTGATLVKAHPFRVDGWLKAVETYRPTLAIPVATHLKILRPSILLASSLLDSFRIIVTSSAPAEPEFKRQILDGAGFAFWEIYGMTETACATAILYSVGTNTDHLGSALPGTEIRIKGQGIGEIEVKSDCLCDGYWGDDERWVASFTSDGFFKSGDLGRLDTNGNLTYLGRVNESFQTAGLMVYPADIEKVVLQMPDITDCVAYPIPNAVFENVVGLVVASATKLQVQEIARHCRSQLPKHMWPARISAAVELPKLSSGKVDRLACGKPSQ